MLDARARSGPPSLGPCPASCGSDETSAGTTTRPSSRRSRPPAPMATPTSSRSSCSTRPCGTPPDAVRRAWLARSLRALDDSLDGRLLVRHGDPAALVPEVAAAAEATSVHVAADFGPYGAAPRRRGRGRARARAAARWCAPGRRTPWRPGASARTTARRTASTRRSSARGTRTAGAPRHPTRTRWPTWRSDAAGRCPATASPHRPSSATRCLPEVGEHAALERWDCVPRRRSGDVRRPARPRRPRRHVDALRAPAVGRDPPAHPARRPRRLPRPHRVPQGARLARVLRRRPAPRPGLRAHLARPALRPDGARRRAPTPTSASRRGAPAAPASRSSTPGCASCSPRAGCTTACAW